MNIFKISLVKVSTIRTNDKITGVNKFEETFIIITNKSKRELSDNEFSSSKHSTQNSPIHFSIEEYTPKSGDKLTFV